MKKLSQAIAMATLVGAAGAANADMFVNGNGLGDVLLYPLYTADAGNDTYFSVTNTTKEYKAVKVRLLEHKNSQEVLDFNLYLSPEDKWSGAITLNAAGEPVLITHDTSCTVPSVAAAGNAGVPLRNYNYDEDSDSSLDRAKIGHIELIEMGNLSANKPLWTGGKTVKQAIEHKNGVPGDCSAVQRAWTSGIWSGNNQNDGIQPTVDGYSGLYGTGTIVNVNAGWQASYDAVALANTYDADLAAARHKYPGDELPNFSDLTGSFVLYNGEAYVAEDASAPTGNGVDAGYNAVSALLTKKEVFAEYIYGAGLDAQTDVVITFPTKREYVNKAAPVAPFSNVWNDKTSKSCDKVNVAYWDTEEATQVPSDIDFSPRPQQKGFELCYETNIMHVGANSNLFGGDQGHATLNLQDGFEAGWLRFDFSNHQLGAIYEESNGDAVDVNFVGMPVIGFTSVGIVNGDILGGVLSNYASTYEHKATPAEVVEVIVP